MQTHDEDARKSDEQNYSNNETKEPTSLHLAASWKMEILPKNAQRLHIAAFDLDFLSFKSQLHPWQPVFIGSSHSMGQFHAIEADKSHGGLEGVLVEGHVMFGSRLVYLFYFEVILTDLIVHLFLLASVLLLTVFFNHLEQLLNIQQKALIIEDKLDLPDISKFLEVDSKILLCHLRVGKFHQNSMVAGQGLFLDKLCN